MEYIDNSLDSAEHLWVETGGKYPRDISVVVKIDTLNKTVMVQDNCRGMTRGSLLRIVEHIGDSEKKKSDFTNGQFGFGIHAYAACANKLEVVSAVSEDNYAQKIVIDRSAYTTGGEIADPIKSPKEKYNLSAGTIIRVTGFDREWWKELTAEQLKTEIEKHFERLLARDRLRVLLVCDGKEIRCSPYDYNSHEGKVIERTITSLVSERASTRKTIHLSPPISVYLKVTEDILPDKRPVFTSKGRRIEEVQAIKSFRNKSGFRTGLWAHQNLTGYIDIAGQLEPTLPRDDFERTYNRGLVYDEIVKLEEEINEALQAINRRAEVSHMRNLEDLLSSTLSDLAKHDLLKFRNSFQPGGSETVTPAIEGSVAIFQPGGKDDFIGGAPNDSDKGQPFAQETSAEPKASNDSIPAKPKRSSGFNVRFSDREQRRSDGTMLRSNYLEGDAIVIYTSHEDFQSRMKRSRQGEPLVSERLVTYLASEIAIHYKDKFYTTKGTQPAVQAIMNQRTDLFTDVVSFIYLFEQALQPFINKSLLHLEDNGSEDSSEV